MVTTILTILAVVILTILTVALVGMIIWGIAEACGYALDAWQDRNKNRI